MKKTILAIFAVIATIIISQSCSKSSLGGNTATVKDLSGSYKLTALSYTYLGASINVYDSLPACEKDNLVNLNENGTVDLVDAGIVCEPPSDDNGTWALQGDSIIFNVEFGRAKIESFNGTTLILSGTPDGLPGATATTTLVKQ